jgi:hypothetical protein
MVRVVPGAIVPRLQGKAVVQSPLVDTHVNPAGVGSSTLTPVATDGPALATVTVYVTRPPGTAVVGPVLVIDRSANCVTVVTTLAALFSGRGSKGAPTASDRTTTVGEAA